MKRLICVFLLMLVAISHALAAPQLSDSLFSAAKQAAQCLVTGDYDALTRMPFSGAAPDAGEWAAFAASFSTRDYAQQEYAVGYWSGDSWNIAVPLRAPERADVEVLLLTSEDGFSFSGYRYSNWGQVEQAYAGSDHVVWNGEYVPAAPQLFAD